MASFLPVILANAGIPLFNSFCTEENSGIPAFAVMTELGDFA